MMFKGVVILLGILLLTTCKEEEKLAPKPYPVAFKISKPDATVAPIGMVRLSNGRFILYNKYTYQAAQAITTRADLVDASGSLQLIATSPDISGPEPISIGSVTIDEDGQNAVVFCTGTLGKGKTKILQIGPNMEFLFSSEFPVSRHENLVKIIPIKDGYLATGTTGNFSGDNYDVLLIKYDKAFNKLWKRNYTVSAPDFGTDITETCDGQYIIGGRTGQLYEIRGWVAKVDTSGNVLFEKSLGQKGITEIVKVQVDDNCQSYILCNNLDQNPNRGGYLACLDKDGNMKWDKLFNGGHDLNRVTDITLLANGKGVLITGYKFLTSDGFYDIYVHAIDMNGNTLWEKTYGEEFVSEQPVAVITDDSFYYLYYKSNSQHFENPPTFFKDRLP